MDGWIGRLTDSNDAGRILAMREIALGFSVTVGTEYVHSFSQDLRAPVFFGCLFTFVLILHSEVWYEKCLFPLLHVMRPSYE